MINIPSFVQIPLLESYLFHSFKCVPSPHDMEREWPCYLLGLDLYYLSSVHVNWVLSLIS